jgi:hypothetical protein
VLVRPDTKHWILKRNIDRVPPGSKVAVVGCNNQFTGIFGTFKGQKEDLALRSETGFIIAISQDIEDLAILISENDWYVDGPAILDLLVA